MAKQPRMGRNLNALLGGAARERTGSTQRSRQTDTDKSAEAVENEKLVSTDKSAASESKKSVIPEKTGLSSAESHVVESKSQPVEAADITMDSSAAKSPAKRPAEQVTASPAEVSQSGATAESVEPRDQLVMVAVDQIRRGTYQPRRLFDQALLEELAESIKAQGLIQPIIVRRSAGAFELVAGERRWRAAQLAGMTELPAIVRDMKDQSVAAVAVIENIQRKDLNPLEEAAAFERLCDEFGMTHKSVAEAVGRSRASVSNLMRLLELHDEVKVLVDKGELEMGHARAILGAATDKQHELARLVISEGLTVRAIEKMVRELNSPEQADKPIKKESMTDPDIERLSQKLGETLGAPVRIQHRSSGAGKLEINYSSVSELQGILAHIK